MTNWKKTISAVMSAALLASVLTTSAFAAKGGSATDSDQTDVLACTSAAVHTLVTCSQVADGISTVTLSGEARTETGKSLHITAAGATIIGVGGQFSLTGGIVTGPADQVVAATDTITLRAPAAAGTAVVSVYEITTATGIAALEGTLTITFTASSGLAVSADKSVVKTLDGCGLTSGALNGAKITSSPAVPTNTWVAYLCVLVKDGNGSGVAGAVVSATITPVGSLGGDVFGQTTTATTDANGVAVIDVVSSGLAGVASISTSATISGKTTGFAPVTFTFTGALATITATSEVLAVYYNGGADWAVSFTGKDAAGNKVFFAGTNTISSDTTVFTIESVDAYDPAGAGEVLINCHKVGSANVVVKQGTIASNAVKVYCSDVPDSFTVAFDKTVVAPGGSAKLTVTVLDENGQPAVGNCYSVGVTKALNGFCSGVAVIVSSGAITPSSAMIGNGATVHTYLAPFNVGVATALVTVDGITDSKSASINIGAVTPPAGTATTASALGVTTTGPFTTSTKVAKLGQNVAVQMKFGAAAAGKTIQVWRAAKNGAGVWSPFTLLTTRIADSAGNIIFNWHSSSAVWLSFQGRLDAVTTANTSQARWQ